MKCPKCNLEIDDTLITCPTCQAGLSELQKSKDDSSQALLMTANNDIQANIIESLLKANGIPMRRKYKGNDTYGKIMLGVTIHGIDLYVPHSTLEIAKGIVENEMPEDADPEFLESEESEEDNKELLDKYDKRRRMRAWAALLLFSPVIIWSFFVAINWLLELLSK